MTVRGNFEIFQYFKFETDFLESVLECRFLVESSKIENASFPYKTSISEATVKTNRMVSTKWTKNEVLPVTTLIFLKILFQFKNLI